MLLDNYISKRIQSVSAQLADNENDGLYLFWMDYSAKLFGV